MINHVPFKPLGLWLVESSRQSINLLVRCHQFVSICRVLWNKTRTATFVTSWQKTNKRTKRFSFKPNNIQATWQHGIYLFCIVKKQTSTALLFQNLSWLLEPWPTLSTTKKAIWYNLLSIQNAAISLVAMSSKDLWLVHKNLATVKPDPNGFRWNENLQRKICLFLNSLFLLLLAMYSFK